MFFIAPTSVREEVEGQYKVNTVGEVAEIKEAFYAISVKKHIFNSITATVIKSASNMLFN